MGAPCESFRTALHFRQQIQGMDSSLRLLVTGSEVPRETGEVTQSAREELVEYMSRVCLGYEKAPSFVVAVLDGALAVCQEWQARPRGRDVPLPPPSVRQARGASGGENTDYLPSPKNVTYNPCVPELPSVLAMMAVKKVNNPRGSPRARVNDDQAPALPATDPGSA